MSLIKNEVKEDRRGIKEPIEKRIKYRKRIILFSVWGFVVVFLIVSMVITKSIYDDNFGRAEKPNYSAFLCYKDISGYPRTEVSFLSGKNKLAGYIYGEENSNGLVVIAHGLGGGAESYTPETMFFVDQGWRVFSYDCTGSYNSEGKSTRGLPQSALDLDAALSYIESQNWGLPVMLYGHSWGGYAVTAVQNYDHDIYAAVSISGYAEPMELLNEQAHIMMGAFSVVTYPLEWFYQKMLFGKAASLSAVKGINQSGIPVMIIHGTEDEMIQYDGASIIAHKEEITNPNVVYKICDEAGYNGHNNLFMSKAQAAYKEVVNKEYREIYDQYNGEIPDEVKEEFYSKVDKFQASELDIGFMDEVNEFFQKALEMR